MGVCNCSMFCCTLLHVHSSIAIILIGKRELVALLNLSSWCLMMVERLFLAVPWGCQRCVIVVFPDHTHLLYLVPILFRVFINDHPEKLSSQVRLFADEIAVYLTVGGSDDGTVLQKNLDKLSAWKSQWNMEFNPSKCKVARVTNARKATN